MAQIKASGVKGISYREHETRKHGKQKDKYFIIRYELNGKTKGEAIGWASEGWTLQKANEILCELKQNHRTGQGPQTLKEKRELLQKKVEEEEEKKKAQHAYMTFDELFQIYLEYAKNNKGEKSWKREESLYRVWVSKILKDLRLNEITIHDIEQIKAIMSSKDSSPRTIAYAIGMVKQIFKHAKLFNYFSGDNPVANVKVKMVDNKRIRFFTKAEAELLLSELEKRSPQWRDIALVSLYAGLRASEIFKLQWNDLYFDTDRIFVKDRKNFNNGMMPMHPKLKEMFLRRQERASEGYVFQSTNGIQIQEVSDTYTRVVNSLGFNKGLDDPRQKVVFHTLRHTYASWLVMNGVDLYTVQRMMGHKDIAMTQRYAHLAPDVLDRAVNVLR